MIKHKRIYRDQGKKPVLTKNAEIIVVTDAPMNPSQVFFGDNLIKGVLPKKKPKK